MTCAWGEVAALVLDFILLGALGALPRSGLCSPAESVEGVKEPGVRVSGGSEERTGMGDMVRGVGGPGARLSQEENAGLWPPAHVQTPGLRQAVPVGIV